MFTVNVCETNNFLSFLSNNLTYIYCLCFGGNKLDRMDYRKMDIDSIIEFVTAGDVSDLSELSSDEQSEEDEINILNNQKMEEQASASSGSDDNDDDIPLAQLQTAQAPQVTVQQQSAVAGKDFVYRWRKRDRPVGNHPFLGEFSDPPEDDPTPLQYFKTFFTTEIISIWL